MTPREELETLAAKVEAAEGADRELDRQVMAVTSAHRGNGCPRYTASLDAAMTLVPEGFEWEVFRWRNASKTFPWLASSKVHLGSINDPTIEVFAAAAPALALCAAALKARASALTGYGEKGE